jgi:hypothetical protein
MESIGKRLKKQKLIVIATNRDGIPYSTLVAFVASPDLKEIFFATFKNTNKH